MRAAIALTLMFAVLPLAATSQELGSTEERAALRELDAEIDGAVVYSRRNHIFKVVIGDWSPVDLGRGEYARWSRDGKWIAVYDRRKVYVMNADGSNRKLVTDLARSRHGCPIEFHSNGREVIFVRRDKQGLWAADIDTGEVRLLTDTRDYSGEPSVSQDGKRLAARVGNRLYAIDLTTGRDFLYVNPACSPGVSPDGRWLMNNGDDGDSSHRSMNVRAWDGDPVHTLRANICEPDRSWDNHHWSNHNDYIAAKGDRQRETYVIRVSKRQGTRVTFDGDTNYPDLYVAPERRASSGLWLSKTVFASIRAGIQPIFTINRFDRRTSSVLVRRVDPMTRANMDLAAWDKSPLAHDPAGYDLTPPDAPLTLGDLDFGGALLSETLADRRFESHLVEQLDGVATFYFAWEPMTEYLMDWEFDLGQQLAEAGWMVEETMWADDSVSRPYQQITQAILRGKDENAELWVKIEFAPWVDFLEGVDDEDEDGYPEIYGRVNPDYVNRRVIGRLRDDYASRELTAVEIAEWEADLIETWYGPYYTVAVSPEARAPFPNDSTEPEIRAELGDVVVDSPSVVIRGEPHGKPVYTIIYTTPDR